MPAITARATWSGVGYSGTEVAAQGQLFTRAALRRYPRIRPDEFRWLLVDRAPAILPELGKRLGDSALRILRRRGLDVRLNTTIEEVTDSQIRLSDGSSVPARTLVWCVGVTPGPLNIIRHHQLVQLGLIAGESPDLAMAEDTGTYYRTDGQPFSRQRQEATR